MSDQELTEPSNEQLARFLVIYAGAGNIPGAENLRLSAPILESIFDRDPAYKAVALKHHRRFQQEIIEHTEKIERGVLQCEHIRPNGKKCPNFNQPGSCFCGLHKEEGE